MTGTDPAPDVAIVLMTYGEPTENTFSAQWMYSYRILARLTRKIAKIPTPLLPLIATKRGWDRVAMWSEHDFVSPLEPLTDQTIEQLVPALAAAGLGPEQVVVTRAFEFRKPLLADVVPGLRDRGVERFVLVPMYAGTGDFTDGMTALAVEDALARHSWLDPSAIEMCRLTDEPRWVEALADAMVDFVREQCAARGIELPDPTWAACLGAHGSVQTPSPGVDNGVDNFGALCWAIYSRLRGQMGMIRNGWLNHERGGRWTEPAVDRVLERIRAAGYTKLMYFPWGFTTDNAESALEGRIFCDEMEEPFERVEYLPCINDAPQLIDFLVARIGAHMRGESSPAAEADAASAPEPALAQGAAQ